MPLYDFLVVALSHWDRSFTKRFLGVGRSVRNRSLNTAMTRQLPNHKQAPVIRHNSTSATVCAPSRGFSHCNRKLQQFATVA